MLQRFDAETAQAFQIQLLNVHGRGLHDNLELVVMLQPVWVFAVAAVFGAARRLYIGHIPWLGAEAPEKGCLDEMCQRRLPCHRAAAARSFYWPSRFEEPVSFLEASQKSPPAMHTLGEDPG